LKTKLMEEFRMATTTGSPVGRKKQVASFK